MNTLDDLLKNYVQSDKKHFQAGDYIFMQGDSARYIYIVVEGQVRLERFTIEGRSVIMHMADSGESFAEASLFSDIYHCNAVAAVPSEIIFYPGDSVLDAMSKNSFMATQFIAVFAHQVRSLRTRLELRNILSARERIFRYLLLNASPDSGVIVVPVPFKQLAVELGLAHETFYRELAAMEKDGTIRRSDRSITILRSSLI